MDVKLGLWQEILKDPQERSKNSGALDLDWPPAV